MLELLLPGGEVGLEAHHGVGPLRGGPDRPVPLDDGLLRDAVPEGREFIDTLAKMGV